jgi:lipoyl(octanoyl) transferase
MRVRTFRSATDSTCRSFDEFVQHREDAFSSGVLQPELLLAELPPTIVYSRKQKIGVPAVAPGIAIAQDSRGGFETYHGPGQWTGYLLLPKNSIAPSGKEARAVSDFLLLTLKSALIPLVPHSPIECRVGKELGLWMDQGKLVSCAFELRREGTLLGFAINVYPTPQSFRGVRPCGLDAKPIYLFEAKQQTETNETSMQKTLDALVEAFKIKLNLPYSSQV